MKTFLFLLFLTTTVFALENKVITEYIVSGSNLSVENLKKTFNKYPPDEVRSLRKGNYLLRYKKDPGLLLLKKAGGKTLKIQPNIIYKSLKQS